jgi:hypothetical protein
MEVEISAAVATWIDRQFFAEDPAFRSGGFGAEVREAMDQGIDHLADKAWPSVPTVAAGQRRNHCLAPPAIGKHVGSFRRFPCIPHTSTLLYGYSVTGFGSSRSAILSAIIVGNRAFGVAVGAAISRVTG